MEVGLRRGQATLDGWSKAGQSSPQPPFEKPQQTESCEDTFDIR
jgi:hypothetical protein